MKKTEVINSKKEITTDIICDCCGESCKKNEGVIENDLRLDNGESFHNFEYMKLEVNWGYYSDHDTESLEAHICEKCVYEKLVPIINFKKSNYL